MQRFSVLGLCATLLILAGCATAPIENQVDPFAIPARQAASKPAAKPAEATPPAEPAKQAAVSKPVEVTKAEPAKPAVASSPIVGSWEGKWTIDSMGYEGKTVIVIEQVDGNNVIGKATMFDTPYGDLTEPFAPATFEGGKLNVKHKNNATYTLTLGDKDGNLRLAGPMVYTTDNGTYNGNIRVSKK